MKFAWIANEVVLLGTPHVRVDDLGYHWPEVHTNGAVSMTTPESYLHHDIALRSATRMAEQCTIHLGWHRRQTTKGLILRMENFPAPKRIVGPFASQDEMDAYVEATLNLTEDANE